MFANLLQPASRRNPQHYCLATHLAVAAALESHLITRPS